MKHSLLLLLLSLTLPACGTPSPIPPIASTEAASLREGVQLSQGDLNYRAKRLIVAPQSERALPLLKQRFGGQVIDQLQISQKHYYLVEIDPERLSAAQAELLDSSHPELPQAQAFSSPASRQTFYTALALQQAHAQEFASIGLETLADLPAAPTINDGSFNEGSTTEGWWRRLTHVEEAWNYSIGTGIRAAYLDQGFRLNHPEIQHRLILYGHNNQVDPYHTKDPNNIEQPPGDHGMASLMVGFAERDNFVPSAGVAPNTQVIPYVADSLWEAARALLLAIEAKPDVMGMNFAWPVYPQWRERRVFQQHNLMREVILKMSQQGIPLVIPAHNYAEPLEGGPREWFPVNLSRDPEINNILPIGGVQYEGSKDQLSAWYNPNILIGFNARGSNYGDNMLWAPSTSLDIANANPLALTPGSMSGTSASCPFMTGVVSLLKSRNPNLSAADLRDILSQTGTQVNAEALFQQPGKTVPLVHVEAALKNAISRLGPNQLARHEPQTFSIARLRKNADGSRDLVFNQGFSRIKPSQVWLYPDQTHPLDGQLVKALGWSGIHPLNSGESEILSINAYRDGSRMESVVRAGNQQIRVRGQGLFHAGNQLSLKISGQGLNLELSGEANNTGQTALFLLNQPLPAGKYQTTLQGLDQRLALSLEVNL